MDDDDIKTIVQRGPSASFSLTDVLPDAPEEPPFEVTLDRNTVDVMTSKPPASPLMVELWTQNRIYLVDCNLVCCDVIDRQTNRSDRNHKFLGARLVGGQRKYGKTLHQTRPFPVAGTECVFTRPVPAGQQAPVHITSRVDRVVLHLSVTTLVFDDENAFDDVTNALLLKNALTPG